MRGGPLRSRPSDAGLTDAGLLARAAPSPPAAAGSAECGVHYADTAVMPIPGGLVLAGRGGRACGIGIIRVL